MREAAAEIISCFDHVKNGAIKVIASGSRATFQKVVKIERGGAGHAAALLIAIVSAERSASSIVQASAVRRTVSIVFAVMAVGLR